MLHAKEIFSANPKSRLHATEQTCGRFLCVRALLPIDWRIVPYTVLLVWRGIESYSPEKR